MIVCTRCKMSKPADEFYRDASKKNGLTGATRSNVRPQHRMEKLGEESFSL